VLPLQQKGDSTKPAFRCQLLFSNFFLPLTFFRAALPPLKVPRNEESRLYRISSQLSTGFTVNFFSGEVYLCKTALAYLDDIETRGVDFEILVRHLVTINLDSTPLDGTPPLTV